MEMKCDQCGRKLIIDQARGVGVCEDDFCALEHPLPYNDADTNGNSVYGEQAHASVVDHNGKAGTSMPIFGNNKDYSGKPLPAKARKLAKRLAQLDTNSQRENDPMCKQLMLKLSEMFGDNLAHTTRFLAEATAKKLKPWQEEIRAKLSSSSERDRLGCPKTSITRKPKGIKGESEKQNLEIMALAIASIAAKLFGTVPINEQALMQQYGISKAQLTNATKTIQQHYKARVSRGWAKAPSNLQLAARRADELDAAMVNIEDSLTGRIAADVLGEIMANVLDLLTDIEEPSLDGPLANVPISMLAACFTYGFLRLNNLHEGNLSCIAHAVGFSGAGVKNRLAELLVEYRRGVLSALAPLFLDSVDFSDDDDGPSSATTLE